MQFSAALLATSLLGWAVASPLNSQLQPRQGSQCSNSGVHIITLAGHGSPPHGYGLLNTTVDTFLEAIPNSSNYSVPFPKASLNYPKAVQIGHDHFVQYFNNYIAECPDTPIVLLGYSEGAIVLMNTLCGSSHVGSPYSPPLNSSYNQYIVATVVYGDETRVPNQPYDYGTCRKGEGVNPRGNPSGCAAFAANIASYCDRPDPQCCGGNNQTAHYQYPTKYNTVAAQYVVNKYDAMKARK